MKSLFLIDRGKPPANFTPGLTYRRAVVSDSSRVARRLAGDTADGCTVWQNLGVHNKGRGLLLVRWRGLDVDYGTELRPSSLPGGMPTGFHHRDSVIAWGLFPTAFWWSSAMVPKWLVKLGVRRWLDEEKPLDGIMRDAVMLDEEAATAKEVGNRPFGFRSVPGWRELAKSPGFRNLWLPGFELAEV